MRKQTLVDVDWELLANKTVQCKIGDVSILRLTGSVEFPLSNVMKKVEITDRAIAETWRIVRQRERDVVIIEW